MIGQSTLIQSFKQLIKDNRLPHFIIIEGERGSGRTTLTRLISEGLQAEYVQIGVGINDIKNMRETALKTTDKTVFHIANGERMREGAKDAILKITEDGTPNSYIVLTVNNLMTIPTTLVSRASVFKMQHYTQKELETYASGKRQLTDMEKEVIHDLCSTCQDVDNVIKYNVEEFMHFVELSVDNVARVRSANAFKIANRLAFKDGEEGYEVKMFLRAFLSVCCNRMQDDGVWYAKGVKVTTQYLQEMEITTLNKRASFDAWVLDIRKAWW